MHLICKWNNIICMIPIRGDFFAIFTIRTIIEVKWFKTTYSSDTEEPIHCHHLEFLSSVKIVGHAYHLWRERAFKYSQGLSPYRIKGAVGPLLREMRGVYARSAFQTGTTKSLRKLKVHYSEMFFFIGFLKAMNNLCRMTGNWRSKEQL